MVKLEREMRSPVCLKLNGYQVVALKPEFDTHIVELERAIQGGVRAYPDMGRVDFYDVALEDGLAYVHIYRDRRVAYLVCVQEHRERKKIPQNVDLSILHSSYCC